MSFTGTGVGAMSYPMPNGPASIIGNVISSNVYTATRQPDISVPGQTTYSNLTASTYLFTNFGTTIPLTPTTTGLTVSIYFKYTAAPYGNEGLWSCRLTSDVNVCMFARQGGGTDSIFGAYNSNFGAQTAPFINIPQVNGYSGNRAAWTAGRIDHIVFTFTNTAPVVGRMYVNGVLNAGPVTSSNVVFVPPDGNYTCYVPGTGYGSADANMSVYDFRIVNATLSAADVAIMYRNLSGTPVSIPVPTPMFFSGAPLFNQLSAAAVSTARVNAVAGNAQARRRLRGRGTRVRGTRGLLEELTKSTCACVSPFLPCLLPSESPFIALSRFPPPFRISLCRLLSLPSSLLNLPLSPWFSSNLLFESPFLPPHPLTLPVSLR